jgi:hypothetical protein
LNGIVVALFLGFVHAAYPGLLGMKVNKERATTPFTICANMSVSVLGENDKTTAGNVVGIKKKLVCCQAK